MSASHPSNEEIGLSPFHALPSHNEKVSSFLSPLNEVMSPCSVEPSSPPFEVTNADSSMNDEIEMEADFSGEDNAKKKSDNDLVLWEGMNFKSLEEFESFYHKLASSEGYTVRIRTTSKFKILMEFVTVSMQKLWSIWALLFNL